MRCLNCFHKVGKTVFVIGINSHRKEFCSIACLEVNKQESDNGKVSDCRRWSTPLAVLYGQETKTTPRDMGSYRLRTSRLGACLAFLANLRVTVEA